MDLSTFMKFFAQHPIFQPLALRNKRAKSSQSKQAARMVVVQVLAIFNPVTFKLGKGKPTWEAGPAQMRIHQDTLWVVIQIM
ncbi:uncharacterized protein PGTG_14793 [Puccinia graminis f. sp. tritici CRL 75-36-700-3]|uniref:Uncharacterized protein n=1 Tax=Puccinia graminis f. sp. tritici (strain CRL 75-36-700-3 / race SCCL) TaxID=418459 RepID=E3KWB3_PUCGT|nr:uncharacterized protein PGTG_14793 [Puccinia graminis f. sp. tritici CRL 75-36-700-3]EFP88588.2 hypothetical protein PGTG_14793 [Puccinia graminis f. sp. tritici CRL 75-36-700-3]